MVDILQHDVSLDERLVGAFVQVKSDAQKFDGLIVGFDGDPQPTLMKDSVYVLFDVLCVSRCGIGNGLSIVDVKVLQLGKKETSF